MTAVEWEGLARALEYPDQDRGPLQEAYVEAFDFDPDCSLEMGWHLYGDRPERGTFLAALRQDLTAAGVSEGANLPDYLPTLLRLIARRDPSSAASLAGTITPAAEQVLGRLRARQHPFAEALEAAVRALEQFRRQEDRP